MKRINKILWHGNEIPLPSAYEGSLDGLNRGELFIYEDDEDPAIFIKTNKNKVKRIGGSGGGGGTTDINEILDLIDQKLNGYATEEWVSSTYATKTALSTLSSSVNSLRTDFNNLNALLNDDVTGKINTWHEVVDFLDEYSGSQDLAAILSGMNTDIASRVEKSKFAEYFNSEMAKWFVKDDNNKGIKPVNSYGLYSDTYVSAKGVSTGTSGGGGGTSYDRLDSWADYSSSKAGYVLSALLGYDLHTRVNNLANAGYITASALSGYAKLSDIPTSLPASDVYSWAKASSKPSYAFSEITNKPTTLSGYGITDALSTSGGTMNGTISYTGNAPLLSLYRLGGGTPYLRFGLQSDKLYGEIGVDSNGEPVFWGYVSGNTTYNKWVSIIHSGNIGSQSVAYATSAGYATKSAALVNNSSELKSVAYVSGNNFYIGDSIYATTSTHILGKDVRLRYGASASFGLILSESGNVGIGTTSPTEKLHVEGNISIAGNIVGDYASIVNRKYNPYVKLSEGAYTVYMQMSDGTIYLGSTMVKSLSVDREGNVSTNGNIVATGSVTAKSSSDYRLKCEFDYNVDYQERLLSLGKVCDFNYTPHARTRELAFADDKRHTSVIWQDARKANITGFCSVEEDGYGTINPLSSDLIFTMVGAIQQGITKTERIEERVVRLEKENEALRKEINDMKGGRYGC